jgi:hypothetical protein
MTSDPERLESHHGQYQPTNPGRVPQLLQCCFLQIIRIQGAKVRGDSAVSGVRLATVLTGLIFSDVIVHGNNIQGGSFGPEAAISGFSAQAKKLLCACSGKW